jgi:hypothetical protein
MMVTEVPKETLSTAKFAELCEAVAIAAGGWFGAEHMTREEKELLQTLFDTIDMGDDPAIAKIKEKLT